MTRWGSGALTPLLHATLLCVSWCHALPGGYWFVGHPSPFFLIGYYGLLSISVLGRRLRLTTPRLLICGMAGLMMWVWSAVALRLLDARWLRVDILDVGHGDSIVVRTPRGHVLLVDAGSREAGEYRVVPFLRFAGISTVDALVLTHTDEDHLGGAIPLLQAVRVRQLLTNGAPDDTMSAREVTRLARMQRTKRVVVWKGATLASDPTVNIEVLHPPRGLVPGTEPDSNDNSVVLKLTKGAVSVLLCGDIEEAGLPWLLREAQALHATILKVPHHGSRLGEVGAQFFKTVKPHMAILSVGRVHHLPASETMQALANTGAQLYLTRDVGGIHLRTDGQRLEVRTFRRAH